MLNLRDVHSKPDAMRLGQDFSLKIPSGPMCFTKPPSGMTTTVLGEADITEFVNCDYDDGYDGGSGSPSSDTNA